MLGDQLRCLFLFFINPPKAASAALDHGKLLVAAALAILVTIAISTAAAPVQSAEFSQLIAPAATSIDHDQIVQLHADASRFLARRFFATGLKSLLLLAVAFVPFCILLLAAWDHLGSGLTVLFRDYMPVLVALLFAWAAAHLPLALLWWSPLMPSSPLVVPFQVVGLLYFLFLAAPVLSTVTGATRTHSAIAAITGLAASAVASTFLSTSSNLLYMLASPWLLFYAYQMFGGDLRALGGGLAARQNLKRQLELATINPHDGDAHYQLGLIYVQRRLPAEAEQRFRRALEIDPAEPEYLFHLGRLLRQQPQGADEARELLEKAAQLNPKLSSHEVWRELGAVELAAGNTEIALRYLTHYTSLREYDPEGLVLHGQALRAAGRQPEATAAFQRAIQAFDAAPRFRRGELARWANIARQELRVTAPQSRMQ